MPFDVSESEFARLVEAALARLPEQFRRTIAEDVPVQVAPRPPRKMLRELGMADDELLLGLYEGPSIEERGELLTSEGGVMPFVPGRIWLFREDIGDFAKDEADLVEQVRVTLLHELGHYMGLDEDDLDALGYA